MVGMIVILALSCPCCLPTAEWLQYMPGMWGPGTIPHIHLMGDETGSPTSEQCALTTGQVGFVRTFTTFPVQTEPTNLYAFLS